MPISRFILGVAFLLGCLFTLCVSADEVGTGTGPATGPQPTEKPRSSLFDGIRRLMGDIPAFDDADATESLLENLSRAEKTYDDIRHSNREAIRNMNRQVRIGNARRSPHLILITLPQWRFDQLEQMPRVNGVRQSGMTFSNYYAEGDRLVASRWSLLAGQLAAQTSADFELRREASLAEVLWQSGYETTLIGTWPTRQHPLDLGYAHWTGFPTATGVVPEHPEYLFTQTTRAKIVGNGKQPAANPLQLLTDETAEYLRRNRNSPRQFFLHVALPSIEGWKLDENIRRQDAAIGGIVDVLNSEQLAGRVCLLITGESSHQLATEEPVAISAIGQNLQYHASGLHEGNLRTPLVVFWGNVTPAGSTCDVPCSARDLLPTFTTLAASQRAPRNPAGVSLVNAFRGELLPVERLLYWKLKDGGQAARRGDWKVVLPAGETRMQLYNLKTDPAEQQNVADQHPAIVDSFRAPEQARRPNDDQSL